MALAPCRECGANVSTEAPSCPQCGVPRPVAELPRPTRPSFDLAPQEESGGMSKGKGCLLIVGGLVVLSLLMQAIESGEPKTEQSKAEDFYWNARVTVKESLKDPESAKFGAIRIVRTKNGFLACGEVNARNSFGGYTGMKRFMSNGAGGTTLIEDSSNEEIFSTTWAELCAPQLTVLTK